jgi:DNA-binding PadR family transcriptional regulator
MSIKHAILGLLSYKPLTGYDLKKHMQNSSFMYWSGNNNQIYKALLELKDEGRVTSEVFHGDATPSKKVYTITDEGLTELKRWVRSPSEAPDVKNPFLVRLAWSRQLDAGELSAMLSEYEREISGRIAIERDERRRFAPDGTPREAAVWAMIYENVVGSYESELAWIKRVRRAVERFDDFGREPGEAPPNEVSASDATPNDASPRQAPRGAGTGERVNYEIIENRGLKYILLGGEGTPLRTEEDAAALITACAENGTNAAVIRGERLSDAFLKLGTGSAGAILQKFATYAIKAAAVLDDSKIKGRFKELLNESNRGDTFRVCGSLAEAEAWLLSESGAGEAG